MPCCNKVVKRFEFWLWLLSFITLVYLILTCFKQPLHATSQLSFKLVFNAREAEQFPYHVIGSYSDHMIRIPSHWLRNYYLELLILITLPFRLLYICRAVDSSSISVL